MPDDYVKLLRNLLRSMQNDAKYLIYGLIIAGIRARASGHRQSDIYSGIVSMKIIPLNFNQKSKILKKKIRTITSSYYFVRKHI